MDLQDCDDRCSFGQALFGVFCESNTELHAVEVDVHSNS